MKLYNDLVISQNRATAKSYAKINLTLDVLDRLPDGYHSVKMVMQSLSLFDLVIVDKTASGIHLSANTRRIPQNNKNIAYKAAQLFFEKAKIKGGAKIWIHKNIPVSAGLAGGSGNAAATLCALNMLYNMPLSETEIFDLALDLGADVPYCIEGGTCLTEGIGEKLTPLSPLPPLPVVLIKPDISISTSDIYNRIDTADSIFHPDTQAVLTAIANKDFDLLFSNMKNAMQSVTEELCPDISAICGKMHELGAKAALMSGSGPTVYGIFEDDLTAKKAFDYLSTSYQNAFFTHFLN